MIDHLPVLQVALPLLAAPVGRSDVINRKLESKTLIIGVSLLVKPEADKRRGPRKPII